MNSEYEIKTLKEYLELSENTERKVKSNRKIKYAIFSAALIIFIILIGGEKYSWISHEIQLILSFIMGGLFTLSGLIGHSEEQYIIISKYIKTEEIKNRIDQLTS